MEKPETKSRRFGTSFYVTCALLGGVIVGLLAGEWCQPLEIVGQIYIGLLQMTVLPFVVLSLVANLGRLNMGTFRRLAGAASSVLAIMWLLMAIMLVILPLALPPWQSGNFFSVGMLGNPPPMDLLAMFIPSNPFNALAENIVPAVVLFCMFVGVGLIGVENRQSLLDNLQVMLRALGRINHGMASLSPVGVFAIVAATAGTIRIDELARLQAYVYLQVGGAILVGLVVIPLLVAALTPISLKAFLQAAWTPLLLAFVTGKTMIVLPMIAERSAQLLKEYKIEEQPGVTAEALVSLGYPFPHLGKLLALLFIPFSAWFMGEPMALSDFPTFLGAGYLSMFGNALASIPFLLDMQHLPSDMFHMFVASGVICGRLSDGLGASSLLAYSVLTMYFLQRKQSVRAWAVLSRMAAAAGIVLLGIFLIRVSLEPLVRSLPSKEKVLLKMHTAVVAVPHREWQQLPPAEQSDPARSRLQRIRDRGALRVGCFPESLPFSFRNADGQLVGFDIDMAHLLAEELQCQLWLVPMTAEQIFPALESDSVDLVMSGVAMTTDRLEAARFSAPYLRVTSSLVVPDFRRSEFRELEKVQRMRGLRIATPPSRRFTEELQRLFPLAEVVTIQSPRDFFEQQIAADALFLNAESASAWSLIYPAFTPVVPMPYERQLPLGYPVAARDEEFAQFVSQWAAMKAESPEFQRLYDYWILGRGSESKPPRWCILRDVMGWLP